MGQMSYPPSGEKGGNWHPDRLIWGNSPVFPLRNARSMMHGFPLMEMGVTVFTTAPEGKVARFMEIVAVAQWSVAAMQPLLRAFAVCSLAYMKGAFGASQRVIEVLRELNAP